MDNSTVHRARGVTDAIVGRGAKVLFLPPYSPDLNPIELMRSKLKNKSRKIKARTPETLIHALNVALNCVSCEDIENWFKHDGYALQ
jgi:transposase